MCCTRYTMKACRLLSGDCWDRQSGFTWHLGRESTFYNLWFPYTLYSLWMLAIQFKIGHQLSMFITWYKLRILRTAVYNNNREIYRRGNGLSPMLVRSCKKKKGTNPSHSKCLQKYFLRSNIRDQQENGWPSEDLYIHAYLRRFAFDSCSLDIGLT